MLLFNRRRFLTRAAALSAPMMLSLAIGVILLLVQRDTRMKKAAHLSCFFLYMDPRFGHSRHA
jgi:hypothetical protein